MNCVDVLWRPYASVFVLDSSAIAYLVLLLHFASVIASPAVLAWHTPLADASWQLKLQETVHAFQALEDAGRHGLDRAAAIEPLLKTRGHISVNAWSAFWERARESHGTLEIVPIWDGIEHLTSPLPSP